MLKLKDARKQAWNQLIHFCNDIMEDIVADDVSKKYEQIKNLRAWSEIKAVAEKKVKQYAD